MPSLNFDQLIFLCFLIVNIVIGLYSARGVKNLKQYAVGDGDFSTIVIAATLVATWISGSFFVNALSETYSDGLYYLWSTSGNVVFFFIMAYIFAPRLGEFIGSLSIAQAMGNLYGKKVRILTAVISSIGSGGLIAAQLNVAGMLIEYGLGIPSIYGVLIAGIIIGIYSALGGIKSVTFTDVIQLITFGTIIPVLAFIVFQSLSSTDILINTFKHNELFNYKEVFDFSRLKSFNFLLLFIYFSYPDFFPAIFQRVAMAKNIMQIKKSFLMAGIVCFFISTAISLIGIFLLSTNGELNPKELLPYLFSNYTYIGLKGLILAGVMSMVMSTADSCINSTSVILIHDFLKPLTLKSKFINNELFATKISAIFVTVLALTISIMGDKNLLKLVLSTQSIYLPMVSVPFILAVFGFRTSGKAVLATMCCALGIVVYLKCMNYPSIQVMFIGVFSSAFNLFFFHYCFKQPGGWVGIKDPSALLLLRAERKKSRDKFIEEVKNFNFMNFLKKSTSKQEHMYIVLSLFSLVIVYSMIFTLPKNLATSYDSIIKIIYPTMTFAITTLLSFPLWPKFMKNSQAIVVVWNAVIFYVLVFGSIFFAIISNFAPIQLMLIATNLILVSMLVRWQLFFSMIILAVVAVSQLLKFYLGNHIEVINLHYIEFKMSYFLVLISAILVTFSKPKQESEDNLEQKVQERTTELAKALAAKTEFLNNMSHEMRSPVNGFANISRELYQNWHQIPEEQKLADMKMVANTATRLSSLIANLLDLNQFSQNNITFTYKKIDFVQLMNESITEAKILNNIKIHFVVSSQDSQIIADEEKMQQVLYNLFANAIKFSPQDSKIDIAIFNAELEYKDNQFRVGVYFSITDQGMGIPHTQLQEIFEPFVISAFSKNKAGGTGLGLALVKEIIKAHKGHVWATNNPASGAIFHILLPQNPENAPEHIVSYKIMEPEQSPPQQEVSDKLNIVVIDDEEFNIRALTMMLTHAGHKVFSCLGGVEGLRFLQETQEKIDIVLLDLMMGDMYGLNVLELIKADPKLAKIAVILQTGTSDMREINKAYEMGIACYIHKPFTTKAVLEAIKKVTK